MVEYTEHRRYLHILQMCRSASHTVCSHPNSVHSLSSFPVAELNLSVLCPQTATMLLPVSYNFTILSTSLKCHPTVSVHFFPGFFPLHIVYSFRGQPHYSMCQSFVLFIHCLYIILLTYSAIRHLSYSPSVLKYSPIMKMEPCAF